MLTQGILKSGESCTMSGIWKTEDEPSTSIRILEGERMPEFRGESVKWKMVQHLPR